MISAPKSVSTCPAWSSGYAESRKLIFPAPVDRRYHRCRLWAFGSREKDPAPTPPPSSPELAARSRSAFLAAADPDRQVFAVQAPPEVEAVEGFWFAWAAFHPETSVYTAAGVPTHDNR